MFKRGAGRKKPLKHDATQDNKENIVPQGTITNIENQYSVLQSFIDSSNTPIFSVDRDYCYTSFNKSHASTMKLLYTADIRLGRSLLNYMTVKIDREKAKKNLDRVLSRRETVTEEDYSGEELLSRRYFEVSHSPIINPAGDVDGVLVMAQDITQRKEVEEVLRESERRFKSIVEHITDIFFILNSNHEMVYVSPQVELVLGYTTAEVRKNWRNYLTDNPVNLAGHEKTQLAITTGEKQGPYLQEYMHRDGTRRLAEINESPLKNDRGEVIGIVGAARDMTERRKAEEALKKSEEKFRLLTEESKVGIYIIQDAKMAYVNQSFAKTFGYSPNEITGKLIPEDIIHPDDIQVAMRRLLERLEGKTESSVNVYKAIKKDGSPIYIEAYGIVIDYQGRPAMMGTLIDITERKRTEEALKKSEEKFRLLTEKSVVGIYIIQDAKMAYVNPSFAKTFGYLPEEIIGKLSPKDLIHADDIQAVMRRLQERLEGQTESSNIVYRALRKGGSLIYIEVYGMLFEYQGRPAVMGTLLDVTERRLSEERLAKSYESLKKTLNDAINTMVKIVEMRDPYTAGHQQKVADLATAIAREMKLEDARIDQLRMAAVIHDIGKMFIPSDILSKPGKLSDMEFSLVKTHSQYGYDIVKGMDFPCSVAEAVLQHHERLDGSGYPNRLKADDTLLEAKILAVADVVEAMSSHRPFRSALGVEKALEEISKNKGKLYDPYVVDACLDLFNSGKFVFKPV